MPPDRSIPIPDGLARSIRRCPSCGGLTDRLGHCARRGAPLIPQSDTDTATLATEAVDVADLPKLYEAWLNDLADDAETLFNEVIEECSTVRLLPGDLAKALRKRAAALGLGERS